MRSTRHLKNHSMGRNERVTYSRPSRTRARPLLAPVVRSCPRGAPTRPLLVPARFSYSSATPTRPLLVPGGCSLPLRGEVRARPLPLRGEVRAPPGHGHYPGCEHPRARALPGVRAPPGTGTTRGANPGYPCVARPPTRPCARARHCPYSAVSISFFISATCSSIGSDSGNSESSKGLSITKRGRRPLAASNGVM